MLDQDRPHLGVSGGLMDDGAQFKLFNETKCDVECNFKAFKSKDEH